MIKSGVNTGTLTQVASNSQEANLALRNLLDKSTSKFKNQLNVLNLKEQSTKEIFENFEKNMKKSYNEAVEKTIYEVLNNETLKVGKSHFEKLLKELEQSGFILESNKAVYKRT